MPWIKTTKKMWLLFVINWTSVKSKETRRMLKLKLLSNRRVPLPMRLRKDIEANCMHLKMSLNKRVLILKLRLLRFNTKLKSKLLLLELTMMVKKSVLKEDKMMKKSVLANAIWLYKKIGKWNFMSIRLTGKMIWLCRKKRLKWLLRRK